MEKDIERLWELREQGVGCAQVMVQLGLEARGEQNEAFIRGVRGLCGGCHAGLTCGALSGAACMINYTEPENEKAAELIEELVARFQERFGATDCDELLMHVPTNRPMVCPGVILFTYETARDLLEDEGYDMTSAFEKVFR